MHTLHRILPAASSAKTDTSELHNYNWQLIMFAQTKKETEIERRIKEYKAEMSKFDQ